MDIQELDSEMNSDDFFEFNYQYMIEKCSSFLNVECMNVECINVDDIINTFDIQTIKYLVDSFNKFKFKEGDKEYKEDDEDLMQFIISCDIVYATISGENILNKESLFNWIESNQKEAKERSIEFYIKLKERL